MGDYVYFEAFNHSVIYFIKKGHIQLGKIDDTGNIITKDILKPGDSFGQFIFGKNSLDGEFAKAIKSDISLCSFTIEKFLQLLHKNQVLSIRFTKLVGWRLRKFENRLINIIQKDSRTRLLLFLRELLQEYAGLKLVNGDDINIPNYLTQDEMARLIGASRQTVASIFGDLRDEGILKYSPKKLLYMQVSKYFFHTKR